MIHALQSVPHMSSKSCEYYKMAGLAPGTSYNETFKIEVRPLWGVVREGLPLG